ncbi:hypothetical protein AX17_007186 [Amanita inopinata Kibby_2008]|nr:hypothetical protein AX17_007186 [Amanita inopinata Kibby_2008]
MYEPIHALSEKSARQSRNVFIWCTAQRRVALGWRVSNDSSFTISTAYRWIKTAVEACSNGHSWKEAESYTLFPVEVKPNGVLMYTVSKNGDALSRNSPDLILPGDYGLYAKDPRLYYFFHPSHSFSAMERVVKVNSYLLFTKALLTPPIIQQALDRDQVCVFSGESTTRVASWIFPPFLGHKPSNDRELEREYYQNPNACDLSQFMVLENVISGRSDLIALFWENKLGVDVDDNYRIIVFEGMECPSMLQSHLILRDGVHPPDHFLRLHFKECLVVSVCRGDVLEDYEEGEIENFMEQLGVYDKNMDYNDQRWLTPLGIHIHADLLRQRMQGEGT